MKFIFIIIQEIWKGRFSRQLLKIPFMHFRIFFILQTKKLQQKQNTKSRLKRKTPSLTPLSAKKIKFKFWKISVISGMETE